MCASTRLSHECYEHMIRVTRTCDRMAHLHTLFYHVTVVQPISMRMHSQELICVTVVQPIAFGESFLPSQISMT